eukprot:370141_1
MYSSVSRSDIDDPYYLVKTDIQQATHRFTSEFDRWNDMLEHTNTATNDHFKPLTESLKSQYKTINRSLKELGKSIQSIESKPNHFLSISQQEIDIRKQFVTDMKLTLTDCRNVIQSSKTKDIMNKHKSEYESMMYKSKQRQKERNLDYVNNNRHMRQQQMERKEQDSILEGMHSVLQRLGVHAHTINTEISSQIKSMDEIDSEMEITHSRLTRLTNKLDDLMEHSNSKKGCMIIILVGILMLLLYFIF